MLLTNLYLQSLRPQSSQPLKFYNNFLFYFRSKYGSKTDAQSTNDKSRKKNSRPNLLMTNLQAKVKQDQTTEDPNHILHLLKNLMNRSVKTMKNVNLLVVIREKITCDTTNPYISFYQKIICRIFCYLPKSVHIHLGLSWKIAPKLCI